MDVYHPHRHQLSPEQLSRIRRDFLGTVSGYKIYVVDGDYIRGTYGNKPIDIDFTEGGNPGRYEYIPEGEIWIEAAKLADMMATVVHEVTECIQMERSRITYDDAHDRSSGIEGGFRANALPELIDTYDFSADLSGGRGAGMNPLDFDQKQVEMGIKIEMEHTNDPLVAMRIVLDHLSEISDYYSRLVNMEKDAKLGFPPASMSNLFRK